MKKTARIFYVLATVLSLSACASDALKDVVLERSDELTSRPKWAKDENTLTVGKDKKVYMLGFHQMPATANTRLSTGYRIAENNAKTALAGAIEQRLNAFFQNAEEGTEVGPEQVRFIGTEATNLLANGIAPANRYWEKVSRVVDVNSGERDMVYRIYARISMDEARFNDAIKRAIEKNAGKKTISEDLKKRADAIADQVTGQLPTE